MKVATLWALMAAGSAPMVAGYTVEWLGIDDVERVLDGEDIRKVAQDIAAREFSSNATLEILDAWTERTRIGEYGETIRPTPGFTFHHVRLAVENTGRIEFGVFTYQITMEDDGGRSYTRAPGGMRDDFRNAQVYPGSSVEGVVIYEAPIDARVASVTWQGTFTSATGVWTE